MKRVLWVCNIMLPAIAQELHLPYSNREGWLSGIFERVQGKEPPFVLGVCFPMEPSKLPQGVKKFTVKGADCFAFREDLNTPEIYDSGLEAQFAQIFEEFKPDIIHIFGTEFPHALAAVRAFNKRERTLIGIQGLCNEIADVYMAGIPKKVQKQVTFRDFIRKDSLRQQQEKFVLRGKNEIEAIKGCLNITGRTRFDKEGTAKINPNVKYFAMNETMRGDFYTGSWDQNTCEKHSIFLGQGDYPLKGMHFVLEAMAQLAPKYPDIKLYVAGNSVVEHGTFKEKLKLPAYGKYLIELMKQYGLEDKVVLTGKLTGEEMKQRFFDSSVFVCPSVLENSPNTVGEAMLLGVPVVASFTGGIPDMLEDGKEGLLVPVGDVKLLAQAIEKLWDETLDSEGKTFAQHVSAQAAIRARITHDGETNYLRLLDIYETIGEEV